MSALKADVATLEEEVAGLKRQLLMKNKMIKEERTFEQRTEALKKDLREIIKRSGSPHEMTKMLMGIAKEEGAEEEEINLDGIERVMKFDERMFSMKKDQLAKVSDVFIMMRELAMNGGEKYMQQLGSMMNALSRDTPEDARYKLNSILKIASQDGAVHLGQLSGFMADDVRRMLQELGDGVAPKIAQKKRRKSRESLFEGGGLNIVISCRDVDGLSDDAKLLKRIRNELQARIHQQLGGREQVSVLPVKHDMHEAAKLLVDAHIYVPMLSAAALTPLLELREGADASDPMLMQFQMALTLKEKESSNLAAIYPMLIGERGPADEKLFGAGKHTYGDFFEAIKKCDVRNRPNSSFVSRATSAAAQQLLSGANEGAEDGDDFELGNESIGEILNAILKHQGCRMLGLQDSSVRAVIGQIAELAGELHGTNDDGSNSSPPRWPRKGGAASGAGSDMDAGSSVYGGENNDDDVSSAISYTPGKYGCMFLSYRVSSDAEFVRELYWRLQTELNSQGIGFKLWWDEESLEKGAEFDQGFVKGVLGSTMFVPILSPDALQRTRILTAADGDNVLLEYRLATYLRKHRKLCVAKDAPCLVNGKLMELAVIAPVCRKGCTLDGEMAQLPEEEISPEEVEKQARNHLERNGISLPTEQPTVRSVLADVKEAAEEDVGSADLLTFDESLDDEEALSWLVSELCQLARKQVVDLGLDDTPQREYLPLQNFTVSLTEMAANLRKEKSEYDSALAAVKTRRGDEKLPTDAPWTRDLRDWRDLHDEAEELAQKFNTYVMPGQLHPNYVPQMLTRARTVLASITQVKAKVREREEGLQRIAQAVGAFGSTDFTQEHEALIRQAMQREEDSGTSLHLASDQLSGHATGTSEQRPCRASEECKRILDRLTKHRKAVADLQAVLEDVDPEVVWNGSATGDVLAAFARKLRPKKSATEPVLDFSSQWKRLDSVRASLDDRLLAVAPPQALPEVAPAASVEESGEGTSGDRAGAKIGANGSKGGKKGHIRVTSAEGHGDEPSCEPGRAELLEQANAKLAQFQRCATKWLRHAKASKAAAWIGKESELDARLLAAAEQLKKPVGEENDESAMKALLKAVEEELKPQVEALAGQLKMLGQAVEQHTQEESKDDWLPLAGLEKDYALAKDAGGDESKGVMLRAKKAIDGSRAAEQKLVKVLEIRRDQIRREGNVRAVKEAMAAAKKLGHAPEERFLDAKDLLAQLEEDRNERKRVQEQLRPLVDAAFHPKRDRDSLEERIRALEEQTRKAAEVLEAKDGLLRDAKNLPSKWRKAIQGQMKVEADEKKADAERAKTEAIKERIAAQKDERRLEAERNERASLLLVRLVGRWAKRPER